MHILAFSILSIIFDDVIFWMRYAVGPRDFICS